MSIDLAADLKKAIPQVPFAVSETKTEMDISVAPEHFLTFARELQGRKELAFDYLRNVTAIDMQEAGLTAKYNFWSFKHHRSLQVTVATPPGQPNVPSITGIYPAANWHEREAAEMVGLVFDGHPNPKNLLLEEDLRIHPLLKAHPLQKVEILQGIEDSRPGFDF